MDSETSPVHLIPALHGGDAAMDGDSPPAEHTLDAGVSEADSVAACRSDDLDPVRVLLLSEIHARASSLRCGSKSSCM